jgi:hypothetical protein
LEPVAQRTNEASPPTSKKNSTNQQQKKIDDDGTSDAKENIDAIESSSSRTDSYIHRKCSRMGCSTSRQDNPKQCALWFATATRTTAAAADAIGHAVASSN